MFGLSECEHCVVQIHLVLFFYVLYIIPGAQKSFLGLSNVAAWCKKCVTAFYPCLLALQMESTWAFL